MLWFARTYEVSYMAWNAFTISLRVMHLHEVYFMHVCLRVSRNFIKPRLGRKFVFFAPCTHTHAMHFVCAFRVSAFHMCSIYTNCISCTRFTYMTCTRTGMYVCERQKAGTKKNKDSGIVFNMWFQQKTFWQQIWHNPSQKSQ